jgi:hypothetical protein
MRYRTVSPGGESAMALRMEEETGRPETPAGHPGPDGHDEAMAWLRRELRFERILGGLRGSAESDGDRADRDDEAA